MCSQLDDPTFLDDYWPPVEPSPVISPRHRHHYLRVLEGDRTVVRCLGKWGCGRDRDETAAKRGKQSRNYGTRAELKVARLYGGEKVGHAGGPVDVRGAQFQTQVKTHRRLPPKEWTTAFGKMAAARERCPRLLLRFVQGPGVAPVDYFVVPASDWLEWFGRDE